MSENGRIRFGIFDFDPARGELRRDGATVRLQSQPAHVLRLLLASAGEVVSREALRAAVRGVDARPSLAKAAWDWGFEDWEDPLGAASHVGNHEIAEYLIGHGARPFTRTGTSARLLFYVGDHEFHPAGAAAVRIRFNAGSNNGSTLTVHDPGLVLTARRLP